MSFKRLEKPKGFWRIASATDSETVSLEVGGVRLEGSRCGNLTFCAETMGKSVPRSVPESIDSYDFCTFFATRSLFSSTSHTAADFARQVD